MGHEKRLGVPLKSGDENDALTGWRKLIRFRPGVRKAAKRTYNRRVRRRPVEVEDDGGEPPPLREQVLLIDGAVRPAGRSKPSRPAPPIPPPFTPRLQPHSPFRA